MRIPVPKYGNLFLVVIACSVAQLSTLVARCLPFYFYFVILSRNLILFLLFCIQIRSLIYLFWILWFGFFSSGSYLILDMTGEKNHSCQEMSTFELSAEIAVNIFLYLYMFDCILLIRVEKGARRP